MMKCLNCTKEINDNDKYCPECGANIRANIEPKTLVINDDIVKCPQCGSRNVHFITREKGENFSATDACCGYLICGPIGLLLGVKNQRHSETKRKCLKCNHEW